MCCKQGCQTDRADDSTVLKYTLVELSAYSSLFVNLVFKTDWLAFMPVTSYFL